MKRIAKPLFVLILVILVFTCDSYAMPSKENNYEIKVPRPENEIPDENGEYQYIWTWLNDELCVQIEGTEKTQKREWLKEKYELGLIGGWKEEGQTKKRYTYSGTWSQAEDGTWSFKFDDKTTPIELTIIDGVLYAFNGYGKLMEGYEYYDGLTTGADGVVNSDDPEFLAWLETQYVPACTSHE